MPLGHVFRLLPVLLATGCLINRDLYEERSKELSEQGGADGAWGVRFAQEPDCIMVDFAGVDLTNEDGEIGPFSFDAYIWPNGSLGWGLYPIVLWPGVFAFYQLDAYTVAGPADKPDISGGANSTDSVMDGDEHHVAVNYGQNGYLSLFIDGARVGYAPVEFEDQASEMLYLGCWPDQGATFVGLIAEARFSDSALYSDEDFEPAWEPYDVSQSTVGLWHLDEGGGADIFDETGEHDGVLYGGEWESFELGPDQ